MFTLLFAFTARPLHRRRNGTRRGGPRRRAAAAGRRPRSVERVGAPVSERASPGRQRRRRCRRLRATGSRQPRRLEPRSRPRGAPPCRVPRLLERDARRQQLHDSPAEHHGDLGATRRTTWRSWLMKIIVRPSSSRRRTRRFSTCAWIGYVERADRLVRDQHVRLGRERAGDADPLTLPAGEVRREPADAVAGSPTGPAATHSRGIAARGTSRWTCRTSASMPRPSGVG